MQAKQFVHRAARFLTILLALTLLLTVGLPSVAQEVETVQISPLMQGMQIARDLIEEDIGATMRLRRWRFFEDSWTSTASLSLYGAAGIDSCTDSIPFAEKRDHILFGWTYIFTTTAGQEYQARVSYDRQASVICDDILIPPQYAPPPVAETQAEEGEAGVTVEAQTIVSTASVGGFALGGHVTSLDGQARRICVTPV